MVLNSFQAFTYKCPFDFRIASNAGRAVGVAVGCIIGMVPLLFYKAEAVEESEQEEEKLVDIPNKN